MIYVYFIGNAESSKVAKKLESKIKDEPGTSQINTISKSSGISSSVSKVSEKHQSDLDIKSEHKSNNEKKSAKTKSAPEIVVTISDDSKSSVQSVEAKIDVDIKVYLVPTSLNFIGFNSWTTGLHHLFFQFKKPILRHK